MTPVVVGSVTERTATQLAESALERMGRGGIRYMVGLDEDGQLLIAGVDDLHPTEMLITCTRTSDPDELADVIRHEVKQRTKRTAQ
jgi:hypothetical protein